MKKIVVILVVLVVLESCVRATVGSEQAVVPQKETTVPKKVKDSLKYDDFMLLTKREAIAKYGQPAKQERSVLNDLAGEFYNGIYNAYTEEEREDESILIDEVTWEKDEDTWVTVWYEVLEKTTIAKDTLTWDKGSDF